MKAIAGSDDRTLNSAAISPRRHCWSMPQAATPAAWILRIGSGSAVSVAGGAGRGGGRERPLRARHRSHPVFLS